MAVPTVMSDLSTTIASNSPAGSDSPTQGDDNIRALMGIVRREASSGSDIASGTTITPDALAASYNITGTTTITTIATTNGWSGRIIVLTFTGALTLTHNASTLILPGGANITTAANDHAIFRQIGVNAQECIAYVKASGLSIVAPTLTQLNANWSFDGSGRLLNGGNTQPSAALYSSANRTTLGTIATYIAGVNIGSIANASTGVITVPVAGTYAVAGQVRGASSTIGGYHAVSVYKNGAVITEAPDTLISMSVGDQTSYAYVGFHYLLVLAASDAIRLEYSGSSGVSNPHCGANYFSVRLYN